MMIPLKVLAVIVFLAGFFFFILPRILCRTRWGCLHPTAALLIFFRNLLGEHILETDPVKFRKRLLKNIVIIEGRMPKVFRAGDLTVETGDYRIPVRYYIPPGDENLPVTLFFHGGGFIVGGIKSVETICRHFAVTQKTVVFSVEYPLAPENKFPHAVEAGYRMLEWTLGNCGNYNGDSSRIRVAGDSAGGNIAALLPFLSRERKGPSIQAQILLYPWVDLGETDSDSFRKFGRHLLLSTEEIRWFLKLYLNNPDEALLPEASPARQTDFSSIPPAVIVVCEFDVLHDQGVVYYEKLKQNGIPAELIELEGMPHGALCMTGWMRKSLLEYYGRISRSMEGLISFSLKTDKSS